MFGFGKKKQLAGIRVAVLAADGVEQVELEAPWKALRNAGAEVYLISLRSGKIPLAAKPAQLAAAAVCAPEYVISG